MITGVVTPKIWMLYNIGMKYTMKLRRVSTHSFSVTIPKELVTKFGWREKQNLSVEEKDRKTLIIKDWKKQF